MKKETWKKLFYYALIALGLLGCMQTFLMFFVSNFHFGVILPGGIGFLLIAYGAVKLIRKDKPIIVNRPLRYTVVTVVTVTVCAFVSLMTAMFVIGQTRDMETEADYIIVLGAGIRGEEITYDLARRVEGAVEYMELHPGTQAILTGGLGAGDPITEAECMRRYMEGKGIAPERIILEEKATSTYENILYSTALIKEKEGDTGDVKVVISTSDYHLMRAEMLASRAGLTVTGIGNDVHPFSAVNAYLRECFAFFNSWLREFY